MPCGKSVRDCTPRSRRADVTWNSCSAKLPGDAARWKLPAGKSKRRSIVVRGSRALTQVVRLNDTGPMNKGADLYTRRKFVLEWVFVNTHISSALRLGERNGSDKQHSDRTA